MSGPLRGQVYRADIGFGAKPWLVVSNNHRNRALSDLLAVRITATDRHANLPTWVQLVSQNEQLFTLRRSSTCLLSCANAGTMRKLDHVW